MAHSQADPKRPNGGLRLRKQFSGNPAASVLRVTEGRARLLAHISQCFAVCSILDKTSCISESAAASPFARSAVT